ncbi:hypothetical protein KOEU_08090 [Komagataeibacter europaeus]|uniref:Uncharacterized protein n=1 Tax=Komagataeibacter europaeus TaxID=33995 RepID=A0A0M0EJV4_KOMEU|nr:hypothetical protein S101446_02416 [Komagataeibacter europaeus]KON65535.1 hypothetical protein KOEU_08090 [Komagataeibacter europaeus]
MGIWPIMSGRFWTGAFSMRCVPSLVPPPPASAATGGVWLPLPPSRAAMKPPVPRPPPATTAAISPTTTSLRLDERSLRSRTGSGGEFKGVMRA